jgi:hypothetical protein
VRGDLEKAVQQLKRKSGKGLFVGGVMLALALPRLKRARASGAASRTVRGAAMAENKTKPTDASVEDYIASRANEEQRADCKALMSIFKRITKQQLGKHKMGKSCLYFKRLADLDTTILEQLIASCVLKLTRRYGTSRGA